MAVQPFLLPTDINDACSLLALNKGRIKILAGGTDLMVRFNRQNKRKIDTLLSLAKLGLNSIHSEGSNLVIGAYTTLADIADSTKVQKHVPLLAKAVSHMATPAVRNAATLGGNLVNGSRNADGIPVLLALGARIKIVSEKGESTMSLENFILTPKKETLQDSGILTEFVIPSFLPEDKWGWEKIGLRKANCRSIVTASIHIQMAGDICEKVRISLGSVAPSPSVYKTAGKILEGKALSTDLSDLVAKEISSEINPNTDVRATAWYRTRMSYCLINSILNSFI